MMLDMMVNDTTGMMGNMNGGPRVDFGRGVRDAVERLKEVCPEDAVMLGMMG